MSVREIFKEVGVLFEGARGMCSNLTTVRSSIPLSLLLCATLSACSAASGGGTDDGDTGVTSDDTGTGVLDDDTGVLDEDSAVAADTGSTPESGTTANDSGAVDSTPVSSDAGEPTDTGPTTTDAALIVEPDDGVTPITNAIKGAKSSVRMEMYLLSDTEILSALVAAKKAGHTVQVLLEAAPYGDATGNQAAYTQLSAASVDVHWTTGLYSLTHTKTFLVDDAHAYVMSLNATYTAVTGDRDYAVRDDDATDVAEVKAIIAADIAGTKPTLTGKLVVSPTNSRAKLTALIDAAAKTLDIEMEELEDSSMVQHLEGALGRGVKIRVVVPATGRPSGMDPALTSLVGKGATVRTLASPDPHAKVILADGATAYVGSVNLSTASLDYNREIGVVVSTPSIVTRLASVIAEDVTSGKAF